MKRAGNLCAMRHRVSTFEYKWEAACKYLAIILSLILSVFTSSTKAQVTIPDPNFVAFLEANYPGCITGNILDTTCNPIINAPFVVVNNGSIQDLTGIQYFDNLQTLDVSNNLLTSLPPLPSTLTFLNINQNFFEIFPELPPGLAQLYCGNNLFTSIPTLPASINVLSCNSNMLTSLPTLNFGLGYLNASGNLLTSLPPLPNSLNDLVVGINFIDSLPDLPPNLNSLICNGNLLTSLPAIPATVTELRVSDNLLESLPALPPLLDYLGCSNNQLTELPAIPPSLNTLGAHDNFLTKLPDLPLPVFSCLVDISNNPITCLPTLPDSILMIFCNTGIQCIPNIPPGSQFTTCGDSLPPVCSGNIGCLPYNVSGYAFLDLNNNCQFDASETPLAGKIIEINSGQYYAYTGTDGYYSFYTGVPGIYTLSQINPSPTLWDLSCNGNLHSVTVVDPLDTFNNRNFPNQIASYCALTTVDIASGSQRLCFNDNTYTVSYCNQGTLSTFNNFIEIEFDPEVIPMSSTLPWTSVTGNVYRFDIGTLAPGYCGSFIITDSVSCDALLNQTACVKARIYPDSTCEPVDPLWDLSSLEVTGICNATNDTVIFSLKNIGIGDMMGSSDVTIYEDDLIMSISTAQLDSGDSIIIEIPATGKTYHMQARQLPGHPGNSKPRSFVELCGVSNFSFDKIIPVMQDDADAWVEIDCHLITGSFDPNEKNVQPSGIGTDHLVSAGDELDYIIQFQNTGTDTAFNILIIDTIDALYLDITSIQPGASSHPYSFSLEGQNVAKFAFNYILLPDSNVNEPASHGFVKYKIRQEPGNLPGTVINNFADIYFDYNLPVRTDTPFVTIDELDTLYFENIPPLFQQTGYEVKANPNPFEEFIWFNISTDVVSRNYSVKLYNILGEEVFSLDRLDSSSFGIVPQIDVSGIYFYSVYNDRELIGSGKLIRK